MNIRNVQILFIKGLYKLTNGRGFRDQKEKSELSLLLLSVILTSILMWGYTITSYLHVDSEYLFKIGIVTSLIHISCPIIYYFKRSIPLSLSALLISGFIQQFSWNICSGGFQSPIIIWLAVFPLIAGVVRGKKFLLVWAGISLLAFTGLFLFHLSGYEFVNLVSDKGFIISQFFLSLGFLVLCSVFMLAYITDREKFYQTLIDKNEQINSLLTIVGHDMSNPLTVVTISTKKLKGLLSVFNDKKINRYLERLDSSGKAMTDILNQIRDIQAIKEGKVELKLEKLHLNTLFEDSLQFFESQIQTKGIKLNYDFEKNKNIYILGHGTSVKYQIFNNVFSNAIKFSDEFGKIDIGITPSSSAIKICIKDLGQGMEKEQLEILFDRNRKTSVLGTLGEKGTGFGMPIVKSFVELNKGRISVNSRTKSEYPNHHGTEVVLSFKNASL